MGRFFLRIWHWLRAEIVFGFMIGSVFWTAVLGWQAAYAPTDAEKQKCYDAAHKAGHKSEECKSFWERSTSDPVAFFTLVLAFSTIGLWGATVFLYRAGERQTRHTRRSAAIQSRDMQASIKAAEKAANAAELNARALLDAQRAHLYATIKTTNISDLFKVGVIYDNSPSTHPSRADSPVIKYNFRNFGKTPAIIRSVAHGMCIEAGAQGIRDFVYVPRALEILGEGADGKSIQISWQADFTFGQVRTLVTGESSLYFFGEVRFVDAFGTEMTMEWEFIAKGDGWHQSRHGQYPRKTPSDS